jgi:hypothetical protein
MIIMKMTVSTDANSWLTVQGQGRVKLDDDQMTIVHDQIKPR